MVKIMQTSQIENIHQKLMKKIRGAEICKKGESIIHTWAFGKRPVHAGQIYSRKVLPNGNIQRRITTAYAGNNSPVGIDTRVYSPQGELLNAYYGVRTSKPEATKLYSTGKEVPDAIAIQRKFNPEMKFIADFIK